VDRRRERRGADGLFEGARCSKAAAGDLGRHHGTTDQRSDHDRRSADLGYSRRGHDELAAEHAGARTDHHDRRGDDIHGAPSDIPADHGPCASTHDDDDRPRARGRVRVSGRE
jgi:hypothetical protein